MKRLLWVSILAMTIMMSGCNRNSSSTVQFSGDGLETGIWDQSSFEDCVWG